jgi:ATP-dependent DNA helicase DinG
MRVMIPSNPVEIPGANAQNCAMYPVDTLPPALHASHSGTWMAGSDGDSRAVGRGEAIARLSDTPTIILNAPLVAQRLGLPELSGLDVLELIAFIYPARFVVPTPGGLARFLGLEPPASDTDAAPFLRRAVAHIFTQLTSGDWPERVGAWTSGQSLARLRWSWAPLLGKLIRQPGESEPWLFSRLPEWEEVGDLPPPRTVRLSPLAVQDQLAGLVGEHGEIRLGQQEFAQAATSVFDPRPGVDQPNLLLAEAGTGIGKTYGYLAPSAAWVEASGGTVWLSTYTKALQRQLNRETTRLYPNADERRRKVVVRKGRENYLCLLNLEDALQGGFAGRAAILAQLVARWAAYSQDGDMVGGDLPGWLPTLFRRAGATALTDRRGECVYAGCPHYRRCFIERASRASAGADIVIANHALVMLLAERQRNEARGLKRIVFDEGHHVHDAADSTSSLALTGQEAVELRRWIIGPEGRHRGRRRGLSARLMDVASYDEAGGEALNAIVNAAQALPGEGWLARITEGDPFGPLEALLGALRATVYARADAQDAGYSLETEAAELDGALIAAVGPAMQALEAIMQPMIRLRSRLMAVIEEQPDWLDGQARARVEGALNSLNWRAQLLGGWLAMLGRLGGVADPDFVDWLAVDRGDGREFDIGMHRHWLDPGKPFAATVLKPADGVLMASATLRGSEDWGVAEQRAGVNWVDAPVRHFAASSPFDYARQAEILIVTDIKRGDVAGLAGAYAALIQASGGGTLGLFTSIQRLRQVHARIADRLAREGLPLFAQHVDPIDTGTLVDIFRDDPHASLMGTDALRDGVDVPGHSLRMVVMEGVPWPRPTVLHAARRAAFGGQSHDDRLIRARMAQAFGRLIRKQDDRGMFVLLSSAMPSRFLSAFPAGTPVRRMTLADAIAEVRRKLSPDGLSSDTDLRHQQGQDEPGGVLPPVQPESP